MDVKPLLKDFLEINPNQQYEYKELTVQMNDHYDTPITINPDEVLTHGQELAQEEERINYWVEKRPETIIIDGEPRALIIDDELLRYDIVADLSPEDLGKAETLHGVELYNWIVDELADEVHGVSELHYFEFE